MFTKILWNVYVLYSINKDFALIYCVLFLKSVKLEKCLLCVYHCTVCKFTYFLRVLPLFLLPEFTFTSHICNALVYTVAEKKTSFRHTVKKLNNTFPVSVKSRSFENSSEVFVLKWNCEKVWKPWKKMLTVWGVAGCPAI